MPGLGSFDPEPDRELGFAGPGRYQRFGAGSGVFVQVSLFLRLMQRGRCAAMGLASSPEFSS